MKKTILAAFLFASGAAQAAFDGSYDVSNWTQSLNGGVVKTTAAPTLVTMISNDDNSGSYAATDFTIAAVEKGVVSFNWSYLNGDIAGSYYDPFGYLLNGNYFQLTSDGDFGAQSGSKSFSVSAGDVFGFRIAAIDSKLGSSYASIRDFQVTSVPEPEAYAMFLAGLGIMGAMMRRKKQA